MRIALPGLLDTDIALQLANALELQFISVTQALEPSSGLPSDDRDIQQIIEKIISTKASQQKHSGFLLNQYPQNVTQAQSLDIALARAGQPLAASLIMESTKVPQNSANKALIRYYRSQNKLIFIEESSTIENICSRLYSIHEKRRAGNLKQERNR